MAVGTGGITGTAGLGNHLTLADGLPFADIQRSIVPVQRHQAAPMVNHNRIAVAAHPAGVDYHAAIGRPNRVAVVAGNINPRVENSGFPKWGVPASQKGDVISP